MSLVKAWSYSALVQWETCPAQYKYQRIDKLPWPESGPLKRGSEIHALAEGFLKNEITALPDELRLLKKEFHDVLKYELQVEQAIAFKADWTSCGWMHPDVWLRIKVDLAWLQASVIHTVDHKTGKIRESNGPQLNLYNLAGLITTKSARSAVSAFWYIDQGKVVEGPTMKRREIKAAKATWEARVAPMFQDTLFWPKQNFGCRWCPFQKAKGGPCPF